MANRLPKFPLFLVMTGPPFYSRFIIVENEMPPTLFLWHEYFACRSRHFQLIVFFSIHRLLVLFLIRFVLNERSSMIVLLLQVSAWHPRAKDSAPCTTHTELLYARAMSPLVCSETSVPTAIAWAALLPAFFASFSMISFSLLFSTGYFHRCWNNNRTFLVAGHTADDPKPS